MTSLTINNQEILNVAIRHKHKTMDSYLSSLAGKGVSEQAEASTIRLNKWSDSFTKFSMASFTPTKLGSSEIVLTNGKNGDFVSLTGSGFKIKATGSSVEKFNDFGATIASLAGDANTTFKALTFGTKGGVLGKIELTSSSLKITLGGDVITVKGTFPTKLGQVYKAIKDMTGLDATTGFDLSKLKLNVLKANSELFKFDIDTITHTYKGKVLNETSMGDKLIKLTSGKTTLDIKGHFPDNAGELYTAFRELFVVNKSGDPYTLFSLVKTIGKTASLHDYTISSITLKDGGKVVSAATLTSKTITLQVGDLKLTAKGAFPDSAADIAKILIDVSQGKTPAEMTLSSLKLVDLADNSVLASTGKLSGVDATYALSSILNIVTGGQTVVGTKGADTITGSNLSEFLGGGAGNDRLEGGAGADKLLGGAGKDTFVFTKISDSTVAASGRDTILDFSQPDKDKIDLKAIDANVKVSGDQAFKFIGTAKFSKKAGELRFENKSGDTYVYGDVDGDGKSDFSILIDASLTLTAADFVL